MAKLTVPQPQVGLQPAGGPTPQAMVTSASEGGIIAEAIGRAGGDIRQAAANLADIQKRNDDLMLREANERLAMQVDDDFYGEAGFFNRGDWGQKTPTAPSEEAGPLFDKAADSAGKNLPQHLQERYKQLSEIQKSRMGTKVATFQRRMTSDRLRDYAISRETRGETEIRRNIQDGAHSDADTQTHLDATEAAVRTSLEDQNKSPEAIEAAVEAARTRLHVSALDQMLKVEDVANAERYLEKFEGDIDERALGQIRERIQRRSELSRAQDEADNVFADDRFHDNGVPEYDKMRADIRKRLSGRDEELALDQLSARIREREWQERVDRDADFTAGLTGVMDATTAAQAMDAAEAVKNPEDRAKAVRAAVKRFEPEPLKVNDTNEQNHATLLGQINLGEFEKYGDKKFQVLEAQMTAGGLVQSQKGELRDALRTGGNIAQLNPTTLDRAIKSVTQDPRDPNSGHNLDDWEVGFTSPDGKEVPGVWTWLRQHRIPDQKLQGQDLRNLLQAYWIERQENSFFGREDLERKLGFRAQFGGFLGAKRLSPFVEKATDLEGMIQRSKLELQARAGVPEAMRTVEALGGPLPGTLEEVIEKENQRIQEQQQQLQEQQRRQVEEFGEGGEAAVFEAQVQQLLDEAGTELRLQRRADVEQDIIGFSDAPETLAAAGFESVAEAKGATLGRWADSIGSIAGDAQKAVSASDQITDEAQKLATVHSAKVKAVAEVDNMIQRLRDLADKTGGFAVGTESRERRPVDTDVAVAWEELRSIRERLATAGGANDPGFFFMAGALGELNRLSNTIRARM